MNQKKVPKIKTSMKICQKAHISEDCKAFFKDQYEVVGADLRCFDINHITNAENPNRI